MQVKQQIKLTIQFITAILICISICSGCTVADEDILQQIQQKEQLSYEDIITVAKINGMDFYPISDENFEKNWPFTKSYVADNGDILIMSDCDGDLFSRKQRAVEMGWDTNGTFRTNKPPIIKEAVASFGEKELAEDYLDHAYTAKNILVYFISAYISPDTEMLNNALEPMLIEVDINNFKIANQIFLHDINQLSRGTIKGTSDHCQMEIDYECYSAPVIYNQTALYDDYLSYLATLTFDESFSNKNKDKMISITIVGPYSNNKFETILPFNSSLRIWYGPKSNISGEEHSDIHFDAQFEIVNDEEKVNKETFVFN